MKKTGCTHTEYYSAIKHHEVSPARPHGNLEGVMLREISHVESKTSKLTDTGNTAAGWGEGEGYQLHCQITLGIKCTQRGD